MSPDRLATAFAGAAAQDRAALVAFVTAGDPSLAESAAILDAMADAGADVVELGMPFTDPMADGPAIQAASLRSLAAGTTLAAVLDLVRGFRERNGRTPVLLMGYFNPILAYGVEAFAADAAAAGADGVILVDVPPEEEEEVAPALRRRGLHLVRLATPTTDRERLQTVLQGATGFLYYVSVAGVTGTRSASSGDIASAVRRLKAATSLPVAVGFGIRTPEQAAEVARHADGVVVGTAIVKVIADCAAERANDIPERVARFVEGLASAVRSARLLPAPEASHAGQRKREPAEVAASAPSSVPAAGASGASAASGTRA